MQLLFKLVATWTELEKTNTNIYVTMIIILKLNPPCELTISMYWLLVSDIVCSQNNIAAFYQYNTYSEWGDFALTFSLSRSQSESSTTWWWANTRSFLLPSIKSVIYRLMKIYRKMLQKNLLNTHLIAGIFSLPVFSYKGNTAFLRSLPYKKVNTVTVIQAPTVGAWI